MLRHLFLGLDIMINDWRRLFLLNCAVCIRSVDLDVSRLRGKRHRHGD